MKSTAAKTAHIWSKEALLAKAQRYAEEMLSHERDDWKFAFWSSLMLEVLARAALANISPALLAESKDRNNPKEWHNLYFALGHAPKAKKFVPHSVGLTEVLSRLAEILPEFDSRLEGFAVLHLQNRNEELHSGATPFENIKNSEWLPLFYESADVLMRSMGEKLDLLVGKKEAAIATKVVAAAKDDSAKAVAKSIAAHKTVWESKAPAEQKKLSGQSALWAARRTGHRVKCPSCDSDSLVIGTAVAAPSQKLKQGMIVVTQSFLPAKFECIACGLKIAGLPQLHACGLANVYTATSTYDPASFYAPYDEYAGYEDDNNEP